MENEYKALLKAAVKAVAKLESFVENEKLQPSAKIKLETIKQDLETGVEGAPKQEEEGE